MKCSKCQFENTESAKFCAECGHNLTLPSEPPPKDLSFDEKIDKIQRYPPKGVTEKILSHRDRIEGEHKQSNGIFQNFPCLSRSYYLLRPKMMNP